MPRILQDFVEMLPDVPQIVDLRYVSPSSSGHRYVIDESPDLSKIIRFAFGKIK